MGDLWSRRTVVVGLPVVCASMAAGVKSLPPHLKEVDGDGLKVAKCAAGITRRLHSL